MRVVYNSATGVVLCAALSMHGAELSALQIYSLYDPTAQGTFTIDDSSLSSEFLMPRAWKDCVVDNVISPTNIVKKNHLVVTTSSSSMVAGGVSNQTVTIQVMNAAGALVTTGVYTLTLSTTSGFLKDRTVTTAAGVATTTLYSSRDTGSAIITAVENTNAILEGGSLQIVFYANGLIPADISDSTLVVSKPFVKSSCLVSFNNAKAHGVGCEVLTDVGGVVGASSIALMTDYTTGTVIGNIAKVLTPYNLTKKKFNFSASFVFQLSSIVDVTHWIGLSGGDPSSKRVADLGAVPIGFPFVGLVFEQGQFAGSQDMSFYFDSGLTSGFIDIIPSLVPTSSNSLYQLDVVSLGVGAGITCTLKIIAGDNVGKIQTWTNIQTWAPGDNDFMGMVASANTKAASAKVLSLKSMYLEQV